jgi:hypothetical protein
MEKSKENTMDAQVRQALENLEVPYQADTWKAMAEKLDALDAQDADFDTQLKNRLDNAAVSNQPSRWDLMQQQLDDLDKQDAQFDDILRERVEKSYIKYQPKHWEMMSRRLDEEFSWKGRIMRYKGAEVAILLLVIFTVFNYLDSKNDTAPVIPFKIETPQAQKIQAQPSVKSFNQGSNWNQRSEQSKGNNNNKQPLTTAQPPIVSVDFIDNNNNNSIQNIDNQYFNNEKNVTNTANVPFSKTDLPNRTHVGSLNTLPLVNAAEIAIPHVLPTISLENIGKTESLAAVEPLSIARPNALSITHLLDEPTLAKRKSKWYTFGVFTSASLDKVSSSYLYKFVENKWHNWSVNKGAGFTLSKHKGKFEFETGLAYHNLKYDTRLPSSVLEGRVVTGTPTAPILTKSVELGLVQIPLSAKLHSKEMGKWNIYGTIGMTANAAFMMDTINFALPAPRSALATTFRSDNETQFPTYEKPFLLGIKKNENNFYFTANVGIGAEYRINAATSIYLQPQIEHHIGNFGIGSRLDKINTLSVQGGVKMRMGVNKY